MFLSWSEEQLKVTDQKTLEFWRRTEGKQGPSHSLGTARI